MRLSPRDSELTSPPRTFGERFGNPAMCLWGLGSAAGFYLRLASFIVLFSFVLFSLVCLLRNMLRHPLKPSCNTLSHHPHHTPTKSSTRYICCSRRIIVCAFYPATSAHNPCTTCAPVVVCRYTLPHYGDIRIFERGLPPHSLAAASRPCAIRLRISSSKAR